MIADKVLHPARIVSMRARLIAIAFLLCAPSVDAAQLYLCKSSDGSTDYWASAWCSTTGGITIDAITVPNGISFNEQVRIAEQVRSKKSAALSAEDRSRDRYRNCRMIDNELGEIWSRYSNRQFNEPAQIGRDQQRTRELKAQRAKLGCETK